MLANTMEKIVVAGAGMTGAMTVALLKKDFPNTQMVILDKSRGTGGRMSTSRSNKVESSTVDLGCQYISIKKEYSVVHKPFHDELISSGLLVPLTCTIEGDNKYSEGETSHYVTPKGVSSVVKHFLSKSGCTVLTDHLLTHVDVEDSKLKVTDSKGSKICDALVLTMPVPQILSLQGNISKFIDSKPDVKQKLESVSYSSRFALGLFYEKGTPLGYQWTAKYIADNPCIRFVAIDNKKRGIESNSIGASVVVHTSVPFSLKHLETDKDEMVDVIMSHLKQVLPDLPQPVEIKSHKWRYSQVHKGYEDSPGCVVLNDKPLIVLAGDGFTHSTLDACIESALAVQKTINELSKL